MNVEDSSRGEKKKPQLVWKFDEVPSTLERLKGEVRSAWERRREYQAGLRHKKGIEGMNDLPLKELVLSDVEHNTERGFMSYFTWQAKNGNRYLFVEAFMIDEDLRRKISVTRAFLGAFEMLLRREMTTRIRWASTGGEYLRRLHTQHNFGHRIHDPEKAFLVEKMLLRVPEDTEVYEATSGEYLALMKRLRISEDHT